MPRHLLTELIDPPDRGRVFSLPMWAGLGDCAPSGRMRLDAIARWLQDVAYADVEDAGLADAAVWVLRRCRLQVKRFPRFAERCSVQTFCSGVGRMWAERRTTIARDGASGTDIEAVALWVHLDPADWRPMPFAEDELAVYAEAVADRRVTARLRHPAPGAAAESLRWRFRSTECDIAAHVNNAAYWQPIEEELLRAGHDPERLDAEIEYRTPSQPDEKLVLSDDGIRWIVSLDGETHASVVIAADG